MIGVSATMAMLPTLAWAQNAAAPAPKLSRTPAVWVGYLLIVVLLGIVMAVSLLPSKRTHQD